MKVATWNVNSLKVRLEHVLAWLDEHQPDVLALQEIKMQTENFPENDFKQRGYYLAISGQKTYNGVALISRTQPHDIETDFPHFEDIQRRILAATINNVRILNLYVPNGAEVGSDKYAYKLAWFEALLTFTREQLSRHDKLILLGDFNIAPSDLDVHDPILWKDKILCSPQERGFFQSLLQLGLIDLFREINQDQREFTWWDYRQAGFRRNLGLRIDHILANTTFSKTCKNILIDKNPRGLERPSDHAPVVAEFIV
jgi:exodeoxyribonuclease-3